MTHPKTQMQELADILANRELPVYAKLPSLSEFSPAQPAPNPPATPANRPIPLLQQMAVSALGGGLAATLVTWQLAGNYYGADRFAKLQAANQQIGAQAQQLANTIGQVQRTVCGGGQ